MLLEGGMVRLLREVERDGETAGYGKKRRMYLRVG
jgi:hypothetical protein